MDAAVAAAARRVALPEGSTAPQMEVTVGVMATVAAAGVGVVTPLPLGEDQEPGEDEAGCKSSCE